MRLLLATDAWTPQVNGVVRSLQAVVDRLRAGGDAVEVLSPADFRSVPCPTYPAIPLALATARAVGRRLDRVRPDAVHIATEGPLGWAARRACLRRGLSFTTAFHTRFSAYVADRTPLPRALVTRPLDGVLRRFHASARATLVATPGLRAELAASGYRDLRLWPRGVDTDLFRPRDDGLLDLPRPIFLNVGRVAVEKNLPAFLGLDLPGTKVVIGDGPARADLARRFPDAVFLGQMEGEALARAYASADVFVFPSLSDTFGNVMLEALASGVPVAAFPVSGPRDVITDPAVGVLDADLNAAALAALILSRDAARHFALRHDWGMSAHAFREIITGVASASASDAAISADRSHDRAFA